MRIYEIVLKVGGGLFWFVRRQIREWVKI